MDERQMTISILISEGNDWRGKWSAQLYKSEDLDSDDESILNGLTGYGDTPLEAAGGLLAMAASERLRRAV